MRKIFFVLSGFMLFALFPAGTQGQDNGTVSPVVARAFGAAGLPVLRRTVAAIDFSAGLPDGTTRTLSALRGKVVFLNFWAGWCGPCRREMPSMEALHQRFKDKGLEMLGVNCQENLREVSAFMENNRLSFETVLDPSGRISQNYGITAIPSTFIIDREGQIISRITGSLDWSNPKIIAAFETLLKN